ncbi:YoaK family protein [Mucilaginibacter sp. CAU 1740]|uniref:YoaK family protein n=1 Tax=Mucilaginibacter sp. CAU 1740 TaxID=3140365 RepID=UPI00325A6EF9
MLKAIKDQRTLKENLMLASSTAFVAGVTNVAGMLAFLVFTSNVTGHVANLAKHIVEQNYHQMIIFVVWLLMFFAGAFVSSFIIRSFSDKSRWRANSTPMVIEAIILLAVAIYGHNFYKETDTEREIVICAVLFSMGLQNSLVSNISGGLIKSSHLTGLFTDLGSEVAERFHPTTKDVKPVENKILIRCTVLGFYLFGGLVGGYFFDLYEFTVFYFIPVILLTIMYYDVSPLALHKLSRMFASGKRQTAS